MRPAIELYPPTLIFSAPFTGPKAFRKITLRNTLAKVGMIFQARMELEQSEFSVNLPHGYGTILPGASIELIVKRTVEHPPEVCCDAYDKVKIYFQYLLAGELPLLSNPNFQTLKKLWIAAVKREKPNVTTGGVVAMPIEIFNTGITQQTWKDTDEWTPFTYRPGVEDKPGFFKPELPDAIHCGGFGSLWKCEMTINGDDKIHPMALKEIKLSKVVLPEPIDRSRVLTRAEKELTIWKQLEHPSVGLVIGWLLEPDVCIMSPWYPNGEVLAFVMGQTGMALSDQRVLRWELVKEIADGMQYLHSKNVVHGDLRHDQILVDDAGHAKIVDFGLAKVIEEGVDTKITTSIRHKGRYEYMAPELLLQTPPRMKESDVYAFGLLMLEVAAAQLAFRGVPLSPVELTRKTVKKDQLPKPPSFSGELVEKGSFWSIFGQCTAWYSRERAKMPSIVAQIYAIVSPLETIYTPSH